MSAGGANRELQELVQELEAIEQRREALQAEVQTLRTQQRQIDDAIESIEELDSGSSVQVPLGGGAFVRAEIADIDEVIVGLGGGYAAERDADGAIDSLKSKKDVLDDRIEDIQADIAELESESEQLEERAQQMQTQQLQQLQQQQQQQQPPGFDE